MFSYILSLLRVVFVLLGNRETFSQLFVVTFPAGWFYLLCLPISRMQLETSLPHHMPPEGRTASSTEYKQNFRSLPGPPRFKPSSLIRNSKFSPLYFVILVGLFLKNRDITLLKKTKVLLFGCVYNSTSFFSDLSVEQT